MRSRAEKVAILLLLPFWFEICTATVFVGPVWVFLPFAWALALHLRRDRKREVPFWVAAGWVLVGVALYGTSSVVALATYAAVTAVALAARLLGFAPGAKLGLAPFILVIGASVPLAKYASFYYSTRSSDLPRILAQPGVTALYGPADRGPRLFDEYPTMQVKSLLPSCGGGEVVLSSGTEGPGILLFGATGTTVRSIMGGASGASDDVAEDCARGVLYVGDHAAGGIAILREGSWAPERTIPLGGEKVVHVTLGGSGDLLCATTQSYATLIVEAATGKELFRRESKVEPRCLSLGEGFVVADDDNIVSVSPAKDGDGKLQAGVSFPVVPEDHNFLAGELAIDAKRHRIYRLPYGDDTLYGLDLTTGTVVKKIRLENGCPGVTYDAARDLLYAGCFVSGNLYILDGESLGVRTKLFVGKRLRRVNLASQAPGLLTVASASGGFAIDLTKTSPAS